MSDAKTVRVEIEFEDGRIISLHGDDAERWQQLVKGMSVMNFVHGGSQEPLPWKETMKPKPVEPLEKLRCAFDDCQNEAKVVVNGRTQFGEVKTVICESCVPRLSRAKDVSVSTKLEKPDGKAD